MSRVTRLLLCAFSTSLGLSACGGEVVEAVAEKLDRYDGIVTLHWDCEGYPSGVVTVTITTEHAEGADEDRFELLCE